jgi:hypothetical protein
MTEPVDLEVSPPAGERNRLTVLARPILAIPHVLMVGGPGIGPGVGGARTGVFGLLALMIAFSTGYRSWSPAIRSMGCRG